MGCRQCSEAVQLAFFLPLPSLHAVPSVSQPPTGGQRETPRRRLPTLGLERLCFDPPSSPHRTLRKPPPFVHSVPGPRWTVQPRTLHQRPADTPPRWRTHQRIARLPPPPTGSGHQSVVPKPFDSRRKRIGDAYATKSCPQRTTALSLDRSLPATPPPSSLLLPQIPALSPTRIA